MSKILCARLVTDLGTRVLLQDVGDELLRATQIEKAQANSVYEMRKALEKRMTELTVKDLTFSLEEYPDEA